MIEYLGGTATGQTLSTVAYGLTVVANETDVLVRCEVVDRDVSEVGWVGFGVGSTMSDGDLVILWPNSDSSWTLSHRRATTTALPLLLGDAVSPPQTDSTSVLSIVPELSSSSQSDSPAFVTFRRPLDPKLEGYTTAQNYVLRREINQGVIFARGDDNPGKEDQDADLKQHQLDSMGGSYVDLSIEYTESSEAIEAPLVPVKGESSTLPSAGGGASSNSSSGADSPATTGTPDADPTAPGSDAGQAENSASSTRSSSATSTAGTTSQGSKDGVLSYATVIKIHAICAASAWLFFAPLGVLYARLGRGPPGTTLFKFPWHFFQQTWITTPLTFGAVALAYYSTTLKSSSSSNSGHKALGFTFAILLMVQVILGWWTHLSHQSGVIGPRALKAWLHLVLGASLIGLGFVQVRLGMAKYGVTGNLYSYGYWASVGTFTTIYVGSLVLNLVKSPPPSPTTTTTATDLPRYRHHHDDRHRRDEEHDHQRRRYRHDRDDDSEDERRPLRRKESSGCGGDSESARVRSREKTRMIKKKERHDYRKEKKKKKKKKERPRRRRQHASREDSVESGTTTDDDDDATTSSSSSSENASDSSGGEGSERSSRSGGRRRRRRRSRSRHG